MKQLFSVVLIIVSAIINAQNLTSTPSKLTEYLTVKERQLKSKPELRILRNEVFARKGYVFKSDDLNTYFTSKSWYKPTPNKPIELTDEEKAYVNKIKQVENNTKPANFKCLNYYHKNIANFFPFTGEKLVKDSLPKNLADLKIPSKKLKPALQRILYGGDVYALDCSLQPKYRLMITNYPKGNYHGYLIEGDVKAVHKLYGSFGVQDDREEYDFILTNDSLSITIETWKKGKKVNSKKEKYNITPKGIVKL